MAYNRSLRVSGDWAAYAAPAGGQFLTLQVNSGNVEFAIAEALPTTQGFRQGRADGLQRFSMDSNERLWMRSREAPSEVTISQTEIGPQGNTLGTSAASNLTLTGTPPAGVVGTAYNFAPTAGGGSGTKRFILDKALPAGLSLNATTGAITGTPTAEFTAKDLLLTVSDDSGATQLAILEIAIAGAAGTPVSLSGTPEELKLGSAYEFTPTTSNGKGTKRYSIRGSLPRGWSFNSDTGKLSSPPLIRGDKVGPLWIHVYDESGSAVLGPLNLRMAASSDDGGGTTPPPVPSGDYFTRRIVVPAAFTLNLPFAINRRKDGQYGHNFNIDLVKPVATANVYAGLSGDNTKDGLSVANKVRSLKQAISKANTAGSGGAVVGMKLDPGYYRQSSIANSLEDSFGNTALTCNAVIESSIPGQAVYSLADVVLPAAVATATDSSVWVYAYTTQSVGQMVIDLAQLDKNDVPRALRRVLYVADSNEATIVAAINARAASYGDGAFYHDTGNKKLYVKRIGGVAVDANLIVMSGVNSNLLIQPAAGASRTVWLGPDIKIYGGNNPLRVVSNSTGFVTFYGKAPTVAHSGSGHCYSFSGGPGLAVTDRAEAYYATQDGLNYTGVAGAGSFDFIELHSRVGTIGLGNDGDGSNNGSTSHVDCRGVRMNCLYEDGTNRTIHDIQNAKTLNFGVDPRKNRFAGNGQKWDASYCVGFPGLAGTAMMWLYGCKSAAENSYDIEAYDGGQAFYTDMDVTGFANDVSGTGSAITAFDYAVEDLTTPPADAIILDPALGKTLQANWSDAVDGKVLWLKPGNHGKPNITRANTQGVRIICEAGATFGKLDITAPAAKWEVLHPKVVGQGAGFDASPKVVCPETGVNSTYPTTASKYLVSVGPGTTDISLEGLSASTTDDISSWTDNDWVYRPLLVLVDLSGVRSALRHSHVYYGRRAVNVIGDDTVVAYNMIEDFAVDGIDFKANRLRLNYNIIRNSRHTDPEPLHTDGIQGYGADGSSDEWTDIEMFGNYIDEGPYQTGLGLNNMQGISSFDGIWKNIRVKDNEVYSNAFHGITWAGVDMLELGRNKLRKLNSKNSNVPWILVSASKTSSGKRPCSNVKVYGNDAQDLRIFQPGVLVFVVSEGSGYTAGNVTVAVDAPPGGTPVATATANVRTTGNIGGISSLTMGEKAIDAYPPRPAAPPNATVTGTNTTPANLGVTVVPSSYYKDALGIPHTQSNVKPDGSKWASPPPFTTI